MRRVGLLAALALTEPALAGTLMDRIQARMGERAAGLDDDLDVASAQGALQLPVGARVERDVAYGSDPAQRLDVYRPAAVASGAPIVLFVHGGGWRRGDKAMLQMVRNKMPHWLGKGYVAVSTNYRLLPDADPLQQADDVARALAFVQGHAARWGADPAQVVLVGHSAGAHLVALLAADATIASQQGAAPWRATVALDSAALDMVAIMSRPHYRFYDPAFGSDPAFWAEASPTLRLKTRPATPVLLVCSSRRTDSCPPAHEFAQKATALGGRVSVLPIELDHLQLNDLLGVPGPYTDAVDAFLHSTDSR